jgi:hypothetical protein
VYEQPINPFQASFGHGEVSPFLYGRVDLQAYGSGLRTSRNGFVRTEGSWSNRPGLQYCAGSLDNTPLSSVLVPFTFNVGQAYIVEIAAGGIQVFFQGQSITNGPPTTITGITLVNVPHSPRPIVILNTATPHGLIVGQNVTVLGILGDAGALVQNGPWTVFSVPSATQFQTNAPGYPIVTYASGGIVQSIAPTSNPYLQSELAALRYTQSADTLTIVHPNHVPYEFKRTSATTFTFLPAVYTMGPFLQQNPDGTTFVYATAQSGIVNLNASAPIFNANHAGALFQLSQQDLSQIPPWEPNKTLTTGGGGILSILGQLRRANGKNYKLVGSPAPPGATSIATGTFEPDHSQGAQSDGDGFSIPSFASAAGVTWQYTDSGVGIVLITQVISSTQVIGTVQPNYTGGPGILPLAVVGGPVSDVVGPWGFTGDGTTKTFNTGTSTASDPNKFIVTVAGAYQQPSLYSISGTSIVFLGAPVNGVAIAVEQITALGQTTYWNFGAFSPDQGYPSAASYVPDRLVLAATPQQPVGVFGSQTSNYHNFGISSPIVNSDAFTIFLNARQLNTISDLVPLQDLIVGTANIIWRLWPGATGTALGPLSIDATPQAFTGESPSCASVLYADSMIFTVFGGRRIRDLVYQFQFDKYVGNELTAYARHLVPFGTQIVKMQYAPDPWGQLYVLLSSGALLTCTYVREQQMIAWSRWDSTNGVIDDIAVIPENNSYALYVIARRTIGGNVARYVERLSQWETSTLLDYQFVDCSSTYDGRNTTANTMTLTGGTSWLSGDVGTLSMAGGAPWVGFQSTDVGLNNQIQLFDADGNMARVQFAAYVSGVAATVRFVDPIPADLQGVPITTWTFARTTFGGAQQLAGQTVAVLADSNALAGTAGVPYLAVDLGGNITLQNAAGVVCVGLQYLSDFETLALNQQGVETLRNRAKSIPHLYLDVTGTRGLLTGTDFTNMFPIKQRAFEPYLAPTDLQEGIIDNLLYSEFDAECHVCVRQPYPLPVTIRMVIPSVNVGEPVG